MEKNDIYSKQNAFLAFFYAAILPMLFAFIVALLYVQGKVDTAFEIIIASIVAPLSFFVCFSIVTKNGNVNCKTALGLDKKLNVLVLLLCVAISFVCFFGFNDIITIFDSIVKLVGYKTDSTLYIEPSTLLNLFYCILLYALLPAIFEELIFRGIIFNGLKQKSTVFALLMSSLFFALIHGSLEQFVYPCIVGFILAFVLLKTGNIIYPIVIHFFNNSIVLVYSYLTYGNSAQNFELLFVNILLGVVYATCAAALIFVIVKLMIVVNKKANDKQQKEKSLNKENLQIQSNNVDLQNNTENQMQNYAIKNNTESNKNTTSYYLFFVIGLVFAVLNFVLSAVMGFM